ncbi:hypothetical protein AVEN_219924-1 [Araneus ventricosus]|uniref:CCHC-type domain-containing protein n=1 Tax=Araneus ventricosus TaxID=182803 RepID=A0A4Y2SZN8_ARAVE|nr:hypothetical protein AVEN_219924-1 [Araneus ventricosus]
MGLSNHTVVTEDTKFFIMSTPDTFHEVSPFLVHKLFLSHIGDVKNVKKLKSGDLLIEVLNPNQAKTLGKLTKLGELNVNVSVHRNLNFSRGVISELGLKKHTESELVEELSEQKVCAARRINIKRDGKLIPTQHVILTFSTTELPRSIKAGYLNCPVKQYIPNPVRCFKCQKFGHSQQACKGSKICAKCSISGHDSADCISVDAKCRNCQGPHPAFSRSCPQWALEKEILTTKIRKNISFAEARRLVSERSPKPGITYSSALKQCAYCGAHTNPENVKINSARSITPTTPVPSSNPSQLPKDACNPSTTPSVTSVSMQEKQKPSQKQLKTTDTKNTDNGKTLQRIKESKTAKKVRLAALKKNKDLKNPPFSKGDFLKQSNKSTVETKNVDPLLSIYPSDDDLMSTASETDASLSSPKKS